MPLWLQRLLALKDRVVSDFFRLQAWGTGSEPNQDWTYYIDRGRTIGIVGADGRIHTMMGRHAVRHEYRDGRLVRRIPVRKDLEPGERLATEAELMRHRREIDARFSHTSAFMMS